jgi:hypothetical protein
VRVLVLASRASEIDLKLRFEGAEGVGATTFTPLITGDTVATLLDEEIEEREVFILRISDREVVEERIITSDDEPCPGVANFDSDDFEEVSLTDLDTPDTTRLKHDTEEVTDTEVVRAS